jgi:hypothetical protein
MTAVEGAGLIPPGSVWAAVHVTFIDARDVVRIELWAEQ